MVQELNQADTDKRSENGSTVPASGRLLFLDGINPETGEALLHPAVHNRENLLTLMNAADDPGFAIRNVEVVFDEQGELALIRRFYVPWQ